MNKPNADEEDYDEVVKNVKKLILLGDVNLAMESYLSLSQEALNNASKN